MFEPYLALEVAACVTVAFAVFAAWCWHDYQKNRAPPPPTSLERLKRRSAEQAALAAPPVVTCREKRESRAPR